MKKELLLRIVATAFIGIIAPAVHGAVPPEEQMIPITIVNKLNWPSPEKCLTAIFKHMGTLIATTRVYSNPHSMSVMAYGIKTPTPEGPHEQTVRLPLRPLRVMVWLTRPDYANYEIALSEKMGSFTLTSEDLCHITAILISEKVASIQFTKPKDEIWTPEYEKLIKYTQP